MISNIFYIRNDFCPPFLRNYCICFSIKYLKNNENFSTDEKRDLSKNLPIHYNANRNCKHERDLGNILCINYQNICPKKTEKDIAL